MAGLLDSLSMRMVQKALDMRQIRQQLIASNIANVDTPHYRSKDVAFEEQLRMAAQTPRGRLATTHVAHLQGKGGLRDMRPEVVSPAQSSVKNDMNSVDLEHEMMKMAENNIMYNSLVTVLKKKFQTIETAIREGGK